MGEAFPDECDEINTEDYMTVCNIPLRLKDNWHPDNEIEDRQLHLLENELDITEVGNLIFDSVKLKISIDDGSIKKSNLES